MSLVRNKSANFPNFSIDHLRPRAYEALHPTPMNSAETYPIRPQATAWLRCAGMFLRIGKPGFGFGVQATNTRPSSANEDLTKEASR